MGYSGRNVLVIGGGKSGVAVKNLLESKGAYVQVYDDYSGDCNGFDCSNLCLKKFDYAVISPGVPLSHKICRLLATNGVPVIGEQDVACSECASKHIFAISGTNGKTTACTLLADMLSRVNRTHLVGNVGIPFCEVVKNVRKTDFVVLETSSFQLEQNLLFSAEIGALTNLGEDHLDRHGSAENYRRIKLSLLNAKCGLAVYNADDVFQREAAKPGWVSYSLKSADADFYLKGGVVRFGGGSATLGISRGVSYDYDFLCAFAVAVKAAGYHSEFIETYKNGEVPSYRNQYVGKLCGADVYNDSKGTNIDATLFAISCTDKCTALILGGSDKGENYLRLMLGIGRQVKRIYITGENSAKIYYAAVECGMEKICMLMPDVESCVAHFAASPLEVLLFSPASASFDCFENYNQRGQFFNEVIEKYNKTAR